MDGLGKREYTSYSVIAQRLWLSDLCGSQTSKPLWRNKQNDMIFMGDPSTGTNLQVTVYIQSCHEHRAIGYFDLGKVLKVTAISISILGRKLVQFNG